MNVDRLNQPVEQLAWLAESQRKIVQRLGLSTWRLLLEHYPRRYEDRARFAAFPTGSSEESICLRGRIKKISAQYFGRRKIVEVTLEDLLDTVLSGRVTCRWFNQHYLQRMLAAGQEVIVFGRPKQSRHRIYLDHPEFELIEEEGGEENIHMGRITPIYPLTEGVRQRALRAIMFRAIQELRVLPPTGELDPDSMPEEEALSQIHFPASWLAREAARKALAMSEFVAMQIVAQQRKRSLAALKGERHVATGELTEQFLAALPFQTTSAQKRAIREIRKDMAKTVPMSRLLQGDVGSGKTLVAAAAMLYAVEAGYQAALMAPTQVLAEQHFDNFRLWLDPLDLRIALRTGTRQETSHLELHGASQIVIGTHALLHEAEQFQRLGLLVVDEQHKFGVLQRSRLLERKPVPDLLVMSATPIPRTLAMTVYGDLEISVLDEKPTNRKPIITRVRPSAKIPEATSFIRERVAAGRQVYIIYPVIEESETLSVKAATTEYRKWEKLLIPLRCGLLHGRLTPQEKERVMEEFRCARIDVLVSTTVIEVGIDVPNATVMLIESSERFGLAQLHQLRGRIGRSQHQSYCILLTDREDPGALDKLAILERSENGFEIAEADLRIRGPGDLLGTVQSGLLPLRLASLVEDEALLFRAKDIASAILDQDPLLQQPQHQRFTRFAVKNEENGTNLAN
ncbi:MAG: ATP-dependent DNA helicase RecG [Verrucomicrobia bacterium]|nr:ATP-dependent DNA helicase RecG [Verrucomicrobiota bacterium]MBV8376453.1 ATP-dependent DNA helicase RecG [Verrucomicrobiota bacterium]